MGFLKIESTTEAIRLADMVENLPAGAIFVENTHLSLNRAAEELTGYTRQELTTLDLWFRLLHDDQAEEIRAFYEQERDAGFPDAPTLTIRRKNGEVRQVSFLAHAWEGGEVWLLLDLTERLEVEQERARLAALMGEAQQLARFGSWEYKVATGVFSWSEEMFRILGVEPAQGEPDYPAYLALYHPQDAALLDSFVARAIAEGTGYELDLRRVISHSLPQRWYHAVGKPMKDAQGNVIRLVGTLQDITERKLAEQELNAAREWLEDFNQQLEATNGQLKRQMQLVHEQAVELEVQKASLEAANLRLMTLSITDGLTGLKNHRAFQEKLTEEFERTQRYKTPVSVVLLDVDKFKTYNDTFGHPEGDIVLKTVAKVLQNTARETDYVCRYGGEEFVILLPNTDIHGAIRAGERFRSAIEEQPWTLRRVTASFGISTLYADLTTAPELVSQADKALYTSKEKGRNRVTHFADLSLLEGAGELEGNISLPYTDIIREMMQLQQDSLNSASDQMREMLANAYEATVLTWTRLLDSKERESAGHNTRVTQRMMELARSIGMNAEEVLYARWGALLHDIGKIALPEVILYKSDPLTEEEQAILRQHTTLAYQMLSPVFFLIPALDIPYCHHENWDGSGYPQGLKGEQIPLTARLFSVIDAYDTLTSSTSEQKKWSNEKANAYLREQAGKRFDPRAVKVFLKMIQKKTEPAETAEILLPEALELELQH